MEREGERVEVAPLALTVAVPLLLVLLLEMAL